jgi:predicted Zn-dependent protease
MFERALPRFEELLAEAPEWALAAAWVAYLRRMLFHEVESELERVSRLAASLTGAERAMTEMIAAQARADLQAGLARSAELLALRPADPYVRHKHAVFLLDLGRPAEASAALEALMSDQPDFTLALNHLGFALLALGQPDRAIGTLRRLTDAEPDNYSARDSLADVLEATGDTRAAVVELEQAVDIEPAFAYGWRHLGDLRVELGEMDAARAAYRAAAANASLYGGAFTDSLQSRLAMAEGR